MAPLEPNDPVSPPENDVFPADPSAGDSFEMGNFEEELKRLAAINAELLADLEQGPEVGDDQRENSFAPHVQRDERRENLLAPRPSLLASAREHPPLSDTEELAMLRMENAELKNRIRELEALVQAPSGQTEDVWLERQREYEVLLEEKSEVIRTLHQKLQEAEENAVPRERGTIASGTGQAEEIFRLKREMDEQRRQLQQDEEDMMAQMRQMEMAMAKERAEIARQRQELTRVQADLTRELELASRDPGLHERLQHLRRPNDSVRPTPAPMPTPSSADKTDTVEITPPENARKSSGFFRGIFG